MTTLLFFILIPPKTLLFNKSSNNNAIVVTRNAQYRYMYSLIYNFAVNKDYGKTKI